MREKDSTFNLLLVQVGQHIFKGDGLALPMAVAMLVLLDSWQIPPPRRPSRQALLAPVFGQSPSERARFTRMPLTYRSASYGSSRTSRSPSAKPHHVATVATARQVPSGSLSSSCKWLGSFECVTDYMRSASSIFGPFMISAAALIKHPNVASMFRLASPHLQVWFAYIRPRKPIHSSRTCALCNAHVPLCATAEAGAHPATRSQGISLPVRTF